jgi:3-(3-hydroxy-phenyl)propionate hydroxylase
MEILDHRGIIDRFLHIGRPVDAGHFSGLRLNLKQLDTRYPYVLGLVQARIETLLEERAAELGVRVRWASEVIGITCDDASVTVLAQRSDPIRADYVVGCDGGRSAVRTLAGIDFPGTEATVTSMLADVVLRDPPDRPMFQERRPGGDFSVIEFEPGWHRLMTNEFDRVVDRETPIDFEAFRQTFTQIAGTDYGMRSPRWVSRYNDAARLAERYRSGRVFLAGDAAHIHWPAGGQGLNTGVQDAVNLGWKLALVLNGHAGDELLDTYEDERRPVGERVLHNTRAQTALGRPGPHTDALRDTLATLIGSNSRGFGAEHHQGPQAESFTQANRYLAGMVTGLDIGHRAPDVPLHQARPVLLGGPSILAVGSAWADRVDLVPGDGDAMLVRPDGYVAWSDGPGLDEALRKWFGAASQPDPETLTLKKVY